MTNNDIVTMDNINNYEAMSRLMGVDAVSSSSEEKKSSTLARVKILHTAIMGEQEIDGKMKDLIKNPTGKLGKEGVDFALDMHVAHREVINSILIEFTHAWYQRDEEPPNMVEMKNWRSHVQNSHPEVEKFIFVHGHIHTPRFEEDENISIYCQGATGLPFDENPKGAVAFLTVGVTVDWEVVRYDYDVEAMINLLEERQPPFYTNLQNTVRYAAIKND